MEKLNDTERTLNVQGVFFLIIHTFFLAYFVKSGEKNYFEFSPAITHFLFVIYFSTQPEISTEPRDISDKSALAYPLIQREAKQNKKTFLIP